MPQDLFKYKETIEHHLNLHPTHLSSRSFVSIFIWKDFFQFEISNIKDHLCVFAKDNAGTFLYLPPLSQKISVEVMDECFEIMKAANKGGGVTRVENSSDSEWSFVKNGPYRLDRKSREFVYERSSIAGLVGNAYKSKRSDYNHFIKNNVYRYLPFDMGMIDECLKLYQLWAKDRRAKYDDELYRFMLEDNLKVHRLAMRFYKELELTARVVLVDNKIKAYTFGFPIDQDYFCTLFEIADTSIKGLPTFIFREFSNDKDLKSYSHINVMDDFHLANIEHTKNSFRPVAKLPVYTIAPKS